MPDLVSAEEIRCIAQFRELNAIYRQNHDLVSLGVYQHGSDPKIDAAVEFQPHLNAFLNQGIREGVSLSDSTAQLNALCRQPEKVNGIIH